MAQADSIRPQNPSGALLSWLRTVGGPETLTSTEAQHWLGVWIGLESMTQAASRFSSGATTARPPPTKKTVAGRAIHKPLHAGTRVVLEDGSVATSNSEAGDALIQTRADIWFDKESMLEDSAKLLKAYTRGKIHGLPDRPPVSYVFLRGRVLNVGGSAPGVDGAPDKVFHLHPQIFAAILMEAFQCLHLIEGGDPWGVATHLLDSMLGSSIDLLLLWIPKKSGDERVGQQRPLQLPSTLRRTF